MSAPVVLADANVLYSAILRDLLMEIAVRRGILLRWTDAIQDEWKNALLKNRPDITPEQVRRTQERMEAALPDARVTGYESLIDGLTMPDADDRHVLAAAITTGASLIVTFNTVDFPINRDVRTGYPVAVHPDNFLRLIAIAAPDIMLAAVRRIIERTRPGTGGDADFVEALKRSGLPGTSRQIAALLGGMS
jgi:predicted nucleic acid-binding protein